MSRTPAPTRIATYVEEAAAAHGVEPLAVMHDRPMGRNRGSPCHPVALARRAVWHRLRADGFGVAAIGRATGFHHTTVIHALRRPEPVA